MDLVSFCPRAYVLFPILMVYAFLSLLHFPGNISGSLSLSLSLVIHLFESKKSSFVLCYMRN